MTVEAEVKLRVSGIPTAYVQHVRAGGADAHGQAALVRPAEGASNPCRHCLGLIAQGEDKLVLAYRPFHDLQPYAEAGPIFLHRGDCARYDGEGFPAWFRFLQPALVRGYDAADWIVYDTGAVIPGQDLAQACRSILAREDVAYVHVRSKFNCFQCRVDRG